MKPLVTNLIVLLVAATLIPRAYSETTVTVELGFAKDGKPTTFWMEAIRNRVSPDALALISERKRVPSASEKAWINRIKQVVPLFKEELSNLAVPFTSVGPLEKAILVLGNQGGNDGFTCSLEHICLDLSQWVLSYDHAPRSEDTDRIIRILSHEYIHLLTKVHLGISPYDPSTFLERAMLDLYVEGLGLYYSLSSKWVSPQGELTDLSKERLLHLETELAKRLKAFKEEDQSNYAQLSAGMNDGRFDQKWGALPIALWLSKETSRDPLKLRLWVDRGPAGILDLIQANISPQLNAQIAALRENNKSEIPLAAKHEGYVFFAIAGLILGLVLLVKLWQGSIVFGLRGRLRKPDLLSTMDQFHNLLIPSLFSLSIICALLFMILGVGHFSLVGITEKWFDYDRATFVTIQAGTMAILFPLVILILDSSDESHSLVISRREVLLRHALAFPIGLALLIFSLYFVFNGASVLATATTITCVGLSLWALYRLLEITFSYEVAKEAEEKILAARVHHIAADDLAERIGYRQTEKAIKNLGGPVEFEHHVSVMLEDSSELDLVKIEADRDGLVVSISLRRLRKAVRSLEQLLAQPNAPTSSKNVPFRIAVSAYPGKILNGREGRELATLVLPHGFGSEEFRATLREAVTRAIKVSTHRSKRSAALDTLMTKLGQSGRVAVKEGNLDLMSSVKETYELLYISISDLLDQHKASLEGIEDPRTSRTFAGRTSNPFESLINQLVQLQRDVTSKKDLDDQVMDRAIYIPHSLAYEALSRGDAKAYGSILGVADVQLGSSVYNKADAKIRKTVIEWLSGLLKYKLLGRRRKKLKSKIDDEQMELARWTVIRLQTAARFSLDANDLSSAYMAIERIHELLDPYRHDHYEHSIEMLQMRLNHTELAGAERDKIAEELDRQQAAMMTEQSLRRWYEISLVAVAGYALQCIEGANHGQPATKENAVEILKYCVSRLPTSFERVFQLQLYAKEYGHPDKWGWGMWESHPRNQVFHPHTETYIQRIFALLFYCAANSISEQFKPSDYELSIHLAWPFRKDEHGLRLLVKQTPHSAEGKAAEITEVSQEQLERLFSLFDEIERESSLQADLKVVNQELVPEKVEVLKREFVEGFSEHAIFRGLVRWTKGDEKKETGLGCYDPIFRDSLIKESNVSSPDVGAHYGEGVATAEDQVAFDELLKVVPQENVGKTIPQAVEQLISKEVKSDTIRIFVTLSAFSATLKEDPNFTPQFRLRGREFPNYVIGIYLVGENEIPVIQIVVRDPRLAQGWCVTSLEQVALHISNPPSADLLPELHINLQVRDPIHHEELQKQLLERDKEKLQGIDPKLWPKLTGKKVYIKVFEGFEVRVKDPKLVFGYRKESSGKAGEESDE